MLSNKFSKVNLDSNTNFWHLAPGRNGFLWETLKRGNTLGYQWCKKDLGNLKKLNPRRKHYKIIKRFTEVKKGDYFCVITAKKFWGIAEVIEGYNYPSSCNSSKVLRNFFKNNKDVIPFQTVRVKWLQLFNPYKLLDTSVQKTFVRINGRKQGNSVFKQLNNVGFVITEKGFNNTGFDKRVLTEAKEHLRWERNQKFVKEYKNKHAEEGCFACKKELHQFYKIKDIKTLLEFHHIKPLSFYKNKKQVKLTQKYSCLLCPNCHRAIHRIMSENENKPISIKVFKRYILCKV